VSVLEDVAKGVHPVVADLCFEGLLVLCAGCGEFQTSADNVELSLRRDAPDSTPDP
jgi:hypothetical protein